MQRLPKIIRVEEEKKAEFHFNKKFFYLFLIIIAAAFIVYGLFFGSFFSVKNIDLKGTNLVDADKVKKVITYALNEEDNLFLYKSADISAKIKENFPLIAEVKIQKGIPDTIRVIVQEREPVIVWQTNDKKYLIDKEGSSYLEADANNANGLLVVIDSQNLPVKLSDKVTSSKFIDFVREVGEKFSPRSNLKIKELRVGETIFDLEVLTTDGFIVLFDTERSAEIELDDLRRVMAHLQGAKPKEYLDLRVEGWAYYK